MAYAFKKNSALLAAGVVLSLAGQPGALAAGEFDGRWSVTLRAEEGSCGTTRTVVVEVQEGKVTYAGQEQVTATGTIPNSGKVALRFAYGGDSMQARGSIQIGTGMGSWTSNKNCRGTWSARRSG